MKTKYFFLGLISTFCCLSVFSQSKTDTVKVWGNCDECKDKIEKAAKKGGAVSADWNMDTYALVVSYTTDKASTLDIEKSIAAVGYDTQDVKASDDSYKKLPKCCQYSRSDNAGESKKD